MDCGKVSVVIRASSWPALVIVTAFLQSCYAQTKTIGGCPVLPADNVWNTPIDRLPVDANSAVYVQTIGPSKPLHPDFGAGATLGIPFIVVPGNQPKVPVTFEYADESDPGPYPVPPILPLKAASKSIGIGTF